MKEQNDLSRQMLKEKELASQFYSTQFRAIADKDKSAVYSTDSDGNILYWNPAAVRLFGYTKDEVLGKQATYLVPEKFHTAFKRAMEFFLAGNTTPYFGLSTTINGLRKNGCEFPIEITIHYWNIDSRVFFSIIINDLTACSKKRQTA